jgi:hypothetical protein
MGDGAGLSDWGLLAGLRFLVGYASGFVALKKRHIDASIVLILGKNDR